MIPPIKRAVVRMEATLVMKTIAIVNKLMPRRTSRSLNVRPKATRGSERMRKRYTQPARRARRKKSAMGLKTKLKATTLINTRE
jgi:hypothetical protein